MPHKCVNHFSKHIACISQPEKKSKLNPRFPDLGLYKKRRGSHTFAHPIIWPWLPIVKDKQLQLAHVRMICSTTPRLYEDVDDRIVIISGRSRCRFFFTINQIAKFDDRRKTSSNVLICLPTHPCSKTSSITRCTVLNAGLAEHHKYTLFY